MKAKPDCILCLFNQALNTARIVTDDPEVQRKILSRVAESVCSLSLDQEPTNLSRPAYDAVAEITGVRDPYEKQKAETNHIALQLLPRLEKLVDDSDDPLNTALHVAVAGNIIDLGIGHEFNLEEDVLEMLHFNFAGNAIEDFRKDLVPGKKLLYLGDNSGEIVFDTLLVKQLTAAGIDVTFTVKSGPIINDATMKDAHDVGMTELAAVIETGSDDIGVRWKNTSDEFREAFKEADIILGKGHGNFETCDDRPENIYFLLKAKCQIVAQELGVDLGDIVFTHNSKE